MYQEFQDVAQQALYMFEPQNKNEYRWCWLTIRHTLHHTVAATFIQPTVQKQASSWQQRPANLPAELLTLHTAAVGTAWPLLGSARNGQAALQHFQKHFQSNTAVRNAVQQKACTELNTHW